MDRVDEPQPVDRDAVLIVYGSFLQRTELAPLWDLRLFVDSSFETARSRGVTRDTDLLGGTDRAAIMFDARYHAACRRYLTEIDPRTQADVIIDNDDVNHPRLHTRIDPSGP